jgi:hypothetical protein
VRIVGEAVGGIDNLRFEDGLAGGAKSRQIRRVGRFAVHRLGFEDFPSEIEAREVGIAVFEVGDDAQAMAVVLESAVAGHAFVEGAFTGMAEWWMAEVVQQGDRFGQVFVEAELPRQRTADLRDFECMREPGAIVRIARFTHGFRLSGIGVNRASDCFEAQLAFLDCYFGLSTGASGSRKGNP